jgi:hypothetical protein
MNLKKNFIFFISLLLISSLSHAQIKSDTNNFNKKRLSCLLAGSTLVYGTAMIGLNALWYKDYPRSSFHFFNDNDEWMQIDKFGHALSAYYESLIGIHGLKWAGVEDKKAIYWGSLFGFVFQLPIEILDGFSAHWGASSGDLLANTLGAGLAFGQYAAWNEQRILFKYSFHPTKFADMRPDLLGTNLVQNVLKDYNGNAFWLSVSPKSFMAETSPFPEWLCFSIGYGADNMLGVSYDKTPPEYKSYIPYRQFYFSLDINTLKIPTQSKFLKNVFRVISIVKVPAPAIEIRSTGKVHFHPLYF